MAAVIISFFVVVKAVNFPTNRLQMIALGKRSLKTGNLKFNEIGLNIRSSSNRHVSHCFQGYLYTFSRKTVQV